MTKAEETRSARRHFIGELMAALVLSAATLLTSWAGFQAALWDGEQAAAYTQAGAVRVEAGHIETQIGQAEGVDLFLFNSWLNAHVEGRKKLEDFHRERFRPEFAHAFQVWIALDPLNNPNAPPSPFAMKDYIPPHRQAAHDMNAKADALFEKGQQANEISDRFTQATVILAMALFLGGIGQTFRQYHLQLVLNLLAGAACIWGLTMLLWLPALTL